MKNRTMKTCEVGKRGAEVRDGSDWRLMTLYREFERHYASQGHACRQMARLRAEVVTSLPRSGATANGTTRSIVDDFFARVDDEDVHLRARGYFELQSAANAAMDRAGQHARDIFSLEAATLDGLLVKVRVLRRALGRHGSQEDGDEGLAAYQEGASVPWFDSVIRDLERLSADSTAEGPLRCC